MVGQLVKKAVVQCEKCCIPHSHVLAVHLNSVSNSTDIRIQISLIFFFVIIRIFTLKTCSL